MNSPHGQNYSSNILESSSPYHKPHRSSKSLDFGELPSSISDDRSAGSSIAQRNLAALRSDKPPPEDQHALSSYQLQLMMLEQQSKKRMALAKQERFEGAELVHKQCSKRTDSFISNAVEETVPVRTAKELPLARTYGQASEQAQPPHPPLPHLDTETLDSMSAEELRVCIKALHQKIDRGPDMFGKALLPRYEMIHRIHTSQRDANSNSGSRERKDRISYLDAPQWSLFSNGQHRAVSKVPITNMELHLERNRDISFLVYRDYDIEPIVHEGDEHGPGFDDRVNHAPSHVSETIHPVRDELVTAIRQLLASKPMFSTWKATFEKDKQLQAPYHVVYHTRSDRPQLRHTFSPSTLHDLDLLFDYVDQRYGNEYADVDKCLRNGTLISPQVMYLFKPGDLLLTTEDNAYVGHVASQWPRYTGIHKISPRATQTIVSQIRGTGPDLEQLASGEIRTAKHLDSEMIQVHQWEIEAWNWRFNGNFQRDHHRLLLRFPITHDDAQRWYRNKDKNFKNVFSSRGFTEARIEDLEVMPMGYATPDVVTQLRLRGRTIWQCRTAKIVSYQEPTQKADKGRIEERFMVDMQTFRKLHNNNALIIDQDRDDLGASVMAAESPPDDDLVLLIQPKVKGYNLRLKKWYDLLIDNITDVTWNQKAFESLVIDQKSKDLILALVTHQIVSEKSTDVIRGKGNGLILLLHGGPGTGKTLTAESVAELAQKPLYRVTCGDVGTKAEDVEKYLESVFHLGKIWDCVVLLDEADVFLEQRCLNDLQRNALVSVFLRVLEYYEGILILTSNRVGTFDEAFKSRIQLALHYPTLGVYQRRRIWEMFIDRLDSMDDNAMLDIPSNSALQIDTDDLRAHLSELQNQPMNGRQIRNAITTARQYAMFKKTTMNYSHLKDVIEVAGRFGRYIDELNHGYTLDELA